MLACTFSKGLEGIHLRLIKKVFFLTLALYIRTIVLRDFSIETIFVNLPKGIDFKIIDIAYLMFIVVWNFPLFIIVYFGVQSFVYYFKNNYIYVLTRKSNIYNTLLFILKRLFTEMTTISIFSFFLLFLIIGLQISFTHEVILGFFSFTVLAMLILLILFVIYIHTFSDEIIAYSFIIYLLIQIGVTYFYGFKNTLFFYQESSTVFTGYITFSVILILMIGIVKLTCKYSNKIN